MSNKSIKLINELIGNVANVNYRRNFTNEQKYQKLIWYITVLKVPDT